MYLALSLYLRTLTLVWVIPLADTKLTPAPSLQPSSAITHLEFDRVPRSFSSPNNQSVLYLAINLQPRCPARHFGRNLLTPALISLSPLAPGHPNDLHISTGNGPPSCFRATSSCPGLDRLVSGPTAMTPGTFTPRPSYTEEQCAHVAFAVASNLKFLTLP